MTFRDKSHRSVLTGTLAPQHHTPWLTALDDSMACYLSTDQDPEVAATEEPPGAAAENP